MIHDLGVRLCQQFLNQLSTRFNGRFLQNVLWRLNGHYLNFILDHSEGYYHQLEKIRLGIPLYKNALPYHMGHMVRIRFRSALRCGLYRLRIVKAEIRNLGCGLG